MKNNEKTIKSCVGIQPAKLIAQDNVNELVFILDRSGERMCAARGAMRRCAAGCERHRKPAPSAQRPFRRTHFLGGTVRQSQFGEKEDGGERPHQPH